MRLYRVVSSSSKFFCYYKSTSYEILGNVYLYYSRCQISSVRWSWPTKLDVGPLFFYRFRIECPVPSRSGFVYYLMQSMRDRIGNIKKQPQLPKFVFTLEYVPVASQDSFWPPQEKNPFQLKKIWGAWSWKISRMSNVQTGTCLQGSRCNYRRIISNVHVTISILGNLQCIIDRIAIVVLFVYILLECLVVYFTPG